MAWIVYWWESGIAIYPEIPPVTGAVRVSSEQGGDALAHVLDSAGFLASCRPEAFTNKRVALGDDPTAGRWDDIIRKANEADKLKGTDDQTPP